MVLMGTMARGCFNKKLTLICCVLIPASSSDLILPAYANASAQRLEDFDIQDNISLDRCLP